MQQTAPLCIHATFYAYSTHAMKILRFKRTLERLQTDYEKIVTDLKDEMKNWPNEN